MQPKAVVPNFTIAPVVPAARPLVPFATGDIRFEHNVWDLGLERGHISIGKSVYSNVAFGDVTGKIKNSIAALKNPPTPSSFTYGVQDSSIEESLFDATATAKILTSQVAMHLDSEWRKKLFRQLDSLHDPEEWEAGDLPLQKSSFSTFLKAICAIKPKTRPGLGLSSGGHLIAAWTSDHDRLTIEFLPKDDVRWVLSKHSGDEAERFAGQTKVSRLFERLMPYQPEVWFG